MTSTTPQAFWDRVAPRYAKLAIRNPAAYEITLELTKMHLRPTDRVLELGCGTGATALRLAPSVGQYVATDYSDAMIAIASNTRAKNEIVNVTPCVANVGDGTLPSGPFDAILAFNLLHLLPDRRTAFAEVFDLTLPGGLFISKTPCLGGFFRVLQPVLAIFRIFGKAPDFNFITTKTLERDIASAGFKIIERGNYPSGPPRRFIVAQKPK